VLSTAVIGTAMRMVIGLIFIAGAATKLLNPYEFLRQVLEYRLLPPSVAPPVAATLPTLELLIGMTLLSGIMLRGAVTSATLLLWAFVALQLSVMSRGMQVECGCFGGMLSPDDRIGIRTISRTAILAVAASAMWLHLVREAKRRYVEVEHR